MEQHKKHPRIVYPGVSFKKGVPLKIVAFTVARTPGIGR